MTRQPHRRTASAEGGAQEVVSGGMELEAPPKRGRPGPGVAGDFRANRERILPQVVPASMLQFCRQRGQQLITVAFPGDLAVAFVIDESERYCYITADMAAGWQVAEWDLLGAALSNLRRPTEGPVWKQFGTGEHAFFLCETFDGYDASRILLARELAEIAGKVAGNLVIGIPHRDYMIAIGDNDPAFLAEVQERVREDFLQATYPITPNLFSLQDGRVVPYVNGAGATPLN